MSNVRKSTTNQRQYVQFSKKIVVAVTMFVSAICLASIIMMFCVGEVQYMADVIKMYIAYAMVVFVAYSGNSGLEKALAKGYLSGVVPPTNIPHENEVQENG